MQGKYKGWLFLCFSLGLAMSTVGAVRSQEAPAAEEEMLSGAELLQNCRPEAGREETPTPYCMEFVYGLVQTLASLQEMMPEAERLFCIDPNRIGLAEVTRNVTDWLEAHPDRLEQPAFLLASEALHENYPCPESNASES